MSIPEGEERQKGAESLLREIIVENFPNLKKKLAIKLSETSRTPEYLNTKRPSSRQITLRLPKVTDKKNTHSNTHTKKNFKGSQEKR